METFQLTASRRGWPYFPFSIFRNRYISTHSLTKRLTVIASPPCNSLIISTHSLTKRLTCRQCRKAGRCNISTHSLTKRLTLKWVPLVTVSHISTHSLTKRLTIILLFHHAALLYFNSQPHEEADFYNISQDLAYIISTHSLTKRLTPLFFM